MEPRDLRAALWAGLFGALFVGVMMSDDLMAHADWRAVWTVILLTLFGFWSSIRRIGKRD